MAERKEKSRTKSRPRKLREFSRGDTVIWRSPVTGKGSYAIFVRYDEDGFPDKDCILAIKGNVFRWPLYLTEAYDRT